MEVIKEENLIENSREIGNYLINQLKGISAIKEVRGMGLMIGIEMHEPIAALRNKLLFQHKIFTGTSSNKNTLRVLPPLCINKSEADFFLDAFNSSIKNK